MPADSLPSTVIVGGGIAGLTAAAALARIGTPVKVFERAPNFERIGAGITIQANAHAVLGALGIALPEEDVVPIGAVEVIDGRGRKLAEGNPDEILPDPPSINIHRADLHRALLHACRDLQVEAGRAVARVRDEGADGVAVEFEDGAVERAELVLGADGVHSAVRRSLRPTSDSLLRYSGQTCWRFAVFAPDHVPKVSVERWSPGRRAGVIPLSRGRVYVYLVLSAPSGTPGPGSSAPGRVRELFGGIDAELDAVLALLDDRVPINHDDLSDREGVFFGGGRTVLIGDAAHPMTPNAGQGAGTGIEDAGELALLLPEHRRQLERLPEALHARRAKRVEAVQRLAWRIGRVAHWRNPLARAVRDLALMATPASAADAQARKLWEPGVELAERIRGAALSV